MNEYNSKKLTLSGLMIALVFVATFSIRIPVPFTQGYIHGGDSMIFVSAILLGWKYGAVAGSLGSAMADLAGGYAVWALPTLIIKGIMGGIAGYLARGKKKNTVTAATIVAGLWFVFSYALRTVINKTIASNPSVLVGKVDGANSVEQLIDMSQKLQSQLLWISILIPIFIIILSIFLHKIDKQLFSASKLLGMTVSGLWMVFAYYMASGILFGNFIVSIFSIPWNIIQFVSGAIIGYVILFALSKTPIGKYLN
ncbi:MAG: ECF transporter S component [Clostridia bacterium]|nr:ECF transporter S component [Clostridia bacterium]